MTGKFPSKWKISKVVPLYKKGERKLLKNYRPVALLSVAGMILERVIAIQIENFFEKNNLFGSFQFGFRNNRSTISEMLTLFDTLLEAKETKKEILVVLYDLSSAFDTVSHDILLTKLQIYGLNNHAIKWIKSYLEDRQQMVTVCGQMSNMVTTNIGTPQGSRLSPLLFICLLADMDLWTENSTLSNFADDTQSIIINENKEKAIEITEQEANNIIAFFESNNLVNNPDKASLLYKSRGKGDNISIENIGGIELKSTNTEKLLGLHINSNFEWSTHVEKVSIELKKRIGLLVRIKNRLPRNKLVMVAEAIFNSKIRYGIPIYVNPVFEEEELKMKKLSKNATILQTLQNTMLRIILGLNKKQHINMEKVRKNVNMFSVNQMSIYHTLLETFNVIRKSSSESIKKKWENKLENKYLLRSGTTKDLIIPEKPVKNCTGFTYLGAKLFNKLPCNIKETLNPCTFKSLIKTWIWKNIPSY